MREAAEQAVQDKFESLKTCVKVLEREIDALKRDVANGEARLAAKEQELSDEREKLREARVELSVLKENKERLGDEVER